jgi:hypothetical protein
VDPLSSLDSPRRFPDASFSLLSADEYWTVFLKYYPDSRDHSNEGTIGLLGLIQREDTDRVVIYKILTQAHKRYAPYMKNGSALLPD